MRVVEDSGGEVIGSRFGRLTVDSRSERRGSAGQTYWHATCDCGARVEVRGTSLRARVTRSCGCLQKDAVSARHTKHGLYRNVEFNVWRGMVGRCHNPKHADFGDYGGRGISVCDRWRDSFGAFLSDMGARPSRLHSIDRIDGRIGYEPGNCRWATPSEQMRNRKAPCEWRRLTRSDVVDLRTLSAFGADVSDLATAFDISRGKVFDVIERRSWASVP